MPVASSRGIVLRAVVLGVVVGAGVVVALVAGIPPAGELRARIAAAGVAAPIVFVLVYAAATLAPVPKNVMSVAAGLLFGLVPAVLLVWVAAMLGAVIAFALGRVLGRQAVERYTGARVARVDDVLTRHGLTSVIGVRLVPVVPFTAINYAAGLTSVSRRHYTIGTAAGIIPGTVAYVAAGAYSSSVSSWPFITAAGALVLLSLGGLGAAWLARRRRLAEGPADPP